MWSLQHLKLRQSPYWRDKRRESPSKLSRKDHRTCACWAQDLLLPPPAVSRRFLSAPRLQLSTCCVIFPDHPARCAARRQAPRSVLAVSRRKHNTKQVAKTKNQKKQTFQALWFGKLWFVWFLVLLVLLFFLVCYKRCLGFADCGRGRELGRKSGARAGQAEQKIDTLLDLRVSSLRRGHANLLCIVPILADDPRGVPTVYPPQVYKDGFKRYLIYGLI